MQTLNVDEDWQARIFEKSLTLFKHVDKIPYSKIQMREKWTSRVLSTLRS